MLPIILVSINDGQTENFLEKFIKENKISRDLIYHILPLKKDISIDQIRLIKKEIRISSIRTRLFILHNFHQATVEAQNALLKSLEENTEKNQFILLVKSEHSILPTIQSRSKILSLKQAGTVKNNIDKDQSNLIKKIEQSFNYRFLAEKKLTNVSKEDVITFIESLMMQYRDELSNNPLSSKLLKRALYLKSLLENNNLNPQLVLDNLLIFINKRSRMK